MRVNYPLGSLVKRQRPLGTGVITNFFPGYRTSFTGKAGEVVYLGIDKLVTGNLVHFMTAQCSCAATIEYTLAEPSEATEPGTRENVLWGSKQDIPKIDVTKLDVQFFTAIKVTFSEDGIFSIYGR